MVTDFVLHVACVQVLPSLQRILFILFQLLDLLQCIFVFTDWSFGSEAPQNSVCPGRFTLLSTGQDVTDNEQTAERRRLQLGDKIKSLQRDQCWYKQWRRKWGTKRESVKLYHVETIIQTRLNINLHKVRKKTFITALKAVCMKISLRTTQSTSILLLLYWYSILRYKVVCHCISFLVVQTQRQDNISAQNVFSAAVYL